MNNKPMMEDISRTKNYKRAVLAIYRFNLPTVHVPLKPALDLKLLLTINRGF